MEKMDKKTSILIYSSLQKYAEKILNSLTDKDWGGKQTNARAKAIIGDRIHGMNVTPSKNTNGHSYEIGTPMKLISDIIINSGSISIRLNPNNLFTIEEFLLVSLIPGGNTINANDLMIEEELSFEGYTASLKLVIKIIETELELVEIFTREKLDLDGLLLESLLNIIEEPVGLIDVYKFNKIIEENSKNTKLVKKRQNILRRYR